MLQERFPNPKFLAPLLENVSSSIEITWRVPKKPLLGEQMAISLDAGQSFKAASPRVSMRLSPRCDFPKGPSKINKSAALDTCTAGGTLMAAS